MSKATTLLVPAKISPLQRIDNEIRKEYPTCDHEMAISLANKFIKYTINSNGLVPSPLVYGVLPRFPDVNTEHSQSN